MPALGGQWARLRLPKGRTYLIFEGDRAGLMVAEAGWATKSARWP